MFPEIPENLADLSPEDLSALAGAIRDACKAALAANPGDAAVNTTVRDHLAKMNEIVALAASKRDTAALAAELDEAEDLSDTGDDDDETEDDDDTDDDADAADEDKVEVKASAPAVVRRKVGVDLAEDRSTGRARATQLLATDGLPGKKEGEAFSDWTEFATVLRDKAMGIRSNSSEKFEIGRIPGNFPENRVLSADPLFNLRMFDEAELTAACDPVTPTYDLSCWNVTRRPVLNSMASFRPERAGVSVYPSPTLQDVMGQGAGVGQWTFEDDADPETPDKECALVECGTPNEYRWYGLYRCITIQNMVQMVLPELVEAYLNRLAAWAARFGDTLLLEAMGNEADTITAPALGYNATTTVTSTILNYLALYQEQQRWDVGEMEAWLPRWTLFAIKADIIRRRRTDGGRNLVPTDDEVATMFRNVGVNPHFFLDTPSWATPIPDLQVAGVLGQFPRNLEILIAPRGKFMVMDRGNLAIGVTGNGIYRDNASNARNNFTMFFENFEGVANMDSCPAHILEIPDLCYNGQQIADVAIDCEGGDYPGVGSG